MQVSEHTPRQHIGSSPGCVLKLINSACMCSLYGNQLTSAGAALLFSSFEQGFESGHLASLNLSDNPGLGDAGITTLMACMPPSLQKLVLSSVGCGDEGAKAVAGCLPRLPQLQSLSLCGNSIACAGAAALSANLDGMQCLEALYISHNCIANQGATVLARIVTRCPSLRLLFLRENPIGAEGREALQQQSPNAAPDSEMKHQISSQHSFRFGRKDVLRVHNSAQPEGLWHASSVPGGAPWQYSNKVVDIVL